MNKILLILFLLLSHNSYAYNFACKEFHPLKIKGPPAKGLNVDTLKIILKDKVNFIFLPWQRAFEDVKSGKYDGLCSCSKAVTRNFLLYSDELGHVETGVFYLKKLPKLRDLKDFKKYRIATIRGYRVDQELSEYNLDHLRVTHETQMVKMLKNKRLDAIYGYIAPIKYQMKLNGLSQTDYNYLPISKTPYFVCLSKKTKGNNELLKKINHALRVLKRSG